AGRAEGGEAGAHGRAVHAADEARRDDREREVQGRAPSPGRSRRCVVVKVSAPRFTRIESSQSPLRRVRSRAVYFAPGPSTKLAWSTLAARATEKASRSTRAPEMGAPEKSVGVRTNSVSPLGCSD